jgi:hypothetical protein
MADDIIKKIENLLNSSTKLSSATKQNFKDQLDLLTKQGAEISRFQALYDSIGDSVDAVSNSLNYIYESLKDSVNELQKQNVYLNAQKSALNKISDISRDVLKIRRGESELDTKRLAKLRLETTEKIRLLEFSKKQYDVTTTEGKAAVAAINDQISTANELYSAFDEVLKVNKAFNKELGLSPGIAAGLDKALQKIGMPSLGIAQALSETKMLHQEAIATGQKINLWRTFSGKVLENFTGLFTKANLLQAGIGFIVDALITADSATGDLAKGFDMSYNSAAKLRMELTDIANFSMDAAVTTKGLQESMVAIGQTLGSNARLNSADLVTFTKLREQAGYTNEELAGIQKLTLATGGNLKDNTASFLGSVAALNGQNKLTINAKQLLKEVANVSDSIKLSIGGTTEKLAEAAFKAKQFGINLQQADQISSNLLDFESSIANELSAELITGKDLNLEKARLLALNGDIAGASAEILQQVGGTAEFSKMNRIQQEAIAKATGLSRDDLAKSLMDKEALTKLSGVEGKDAQEKYNNLVKQYGVEEAKKRLGDEALANQFQQQSVQERFTQSIEKLKELFVSLVEPLMPVFDIFADIMKVVAPIAGILGTMVKYAIDFGKYLLIPYGIYKGIQAYQKANMLLSLADMEIKRAGTAEFMKQNALATEQGLIDKGRLFLRQSLLFVMNQEYRTAVLNAAQEKITQSINKLSLFIEESKLALKGKINATLIREIALEGVAKAKALGGFLVDIGKFAVKSAMAVAGIPVVGPILAVAAMAAAVGGGMALYSKFKGDDVMSEGGYGNRTLLTPKGSIALNDKDTVIAGTNLGGGGNKNNSPQPQQDNSALIAEMRAMRQESSRSNNKPVVVENSMNGTKFGTSVAMNTYKVQ